MAEVELSFLPILPHIFTSQSTRKIYSQPAKELDLVELNTTYYTMNLLRNWLKSSLPNYEYNGAHINVDPIYIYQDSSLIYVRDTYDLFLTADNKVYSHPASYATPQEEIHKRKLYASYHNWYPEKSGYPLVHRAKLNDLPLHSGKSFVLTWHQDHHNYWHYTFDALFRLFLLHRFLNINFEDISIVAIGETLNQWQFDLLTKLVGYPPQINYYRRGVCLDNVVSIPSNNTSLYDSTLLQGFRSRIFPESHCLSLSEASAHSPRVLYIPRGSARNGRCLANENEVIQYLQNYNITVFDPGQHALDIQQETFNSADIVVGVHGSAMLNLFYMKPNRFVIELSSCLYDPVHDYILASMMSVTLLRIRCASLGNNTSSNLFCDLSKLHRALQLVAKNAYL